jgi:hypothetical protein
MAYKDYSDEDKTLIYDLRQIYAKDIIGNTLLQIKMARTSENYPLWYHSLKRDLLTEISQKLTDIEINQVKEKIEQVKKVLVKNSESYIGKHKDANAHELIEDCLCELEMLMTGLMERHNMYGNKEDDEGL